MRLQVLHFMQVTQRGYTAPVHFCWSGRRHHWIQRTIFRLRTWKK